MQQFATEIRNLDQYACKVLSKLRYAHSVRVAQTAQKLAQHFAYSEPEVAYYAGLGHDIAKELPKPTVLKLCQQLGRLKKEDSQFVSVLHGRVAAYIIQKELGFYRADVDKAFCLHTTGGLNMTPLSQIVYITDYIEPGRPYMAQSPIDFAQYKSLNDLAQFVCFRSVKYLQSCGLAVYPETVAWMVETSPYIERTNISCISK